LLRGHWPDGTILDFSYDTEEIWDRPLFHLGSTARSNSRQGIKGQSEA
jgi:hypothetical protein